MKKLFTIGLTVLSFLSTAYGGDVDSIAAKIVAENFYFTRLNQTSMGQLKSIAQDAELVLVHREFDHSVEGKVHDQIGDSKPLYYIFNVKDNNGFVIVSGDDRVIPVLGYAFSGEFSKDHLSPAFESWMQNYATQIKALSGKIQKTDKFILEEWNTYLSASVKKSGKAISEVLPLLSTTWDQGCYYNNFCPEDDDLECGRTLVGCTSVATAQIMKYWNHPVSSSHIPGYNDELNYSDEEPINGSDYGCLPDITPTAYAWSNMPDKLNQSSTNQQTQNVSKLLYNVAVAILTDFEPDGSSAYTRYSMDALVSYFNYSPSIQRIFKDDYTDDDWENQIIEELDNNRPVLYVGYGSGGHAFVCDGYHTSDYMHFNWGWGGYEDGYFYLAELTPGSSDYSESQHAIIGIVPEAVQADPFDHVIQIDAYSSDHIQSFSGGGTGSWNLNDCGYFTPGLEQIYGFTAPETGLYSIEVVSASGFVDYSWRATSCGDPGWTCIEDIFSDGRYGMLSWTAGTSYQLLLDDEDDTEGTHQFYLEYYGDPELGFESYEIDDDKTSSGNNNGVAEPGESIEMKLILRNSGSGDTHNVSAVLSTTDSYIIIDDDYEEFGDIPAGGSVVCTADYYFSIASDCPGNRDIPFTLEVISDEGSWSVQFDLFVYSSAPDPCENVIPVNGYGMDYSQTFMSDPGGAWNSGNCGVDTPGSEQVYSFNAPKTGFYNIEVLSAIGDVSYAWSELGCGETAWTCIDNLNSAGGYANLLWAEGSTYHLLLDGEGSSKGTHQFYINYLGHPDLRYSSQKIDDGLQTGSNNNNGLAEPGETIGMQLTLHNIGNYDSQNVSAVVSTSDTDISIIDDEELYGDIAIEASVLCEDNFEFSISQDCLGDRDIPFIIDITSDEGSWSDQFILHVYPSPPDPCENVIPMDGYGAEYSETFTSVVGGAWNSGNCGKNRPGTEQIYSFAAQEAGLYSMEVVSANGDAYYSWSNSGCGETAWTCIADVNSAGRYDTMVLSAGTTYHFLLDGMGSTENTHQFYLKYLGHPDLGYSGHEIDDGLHSGSNNNNGLAEPGETIRMQLSLQNSGSYDSHNVSAVISSMDPDITIIDDQKTYGKIEIGSVLVSDAFFEFSISQDCLGDRDIPFIIAVTSDEGSWSVQFNLHVYLSPPEPCENVISIEGYGADYAQTFTAEGGGAWNSGICGVNTPGTEQVYSFDAPETGLYNIEMVSANGDVYFSWSNSGCGETAWTCISNLKAVATYEKLILTEGSTYHFLLDSEGSTESTHLFYINYLGFPDLGYSSHEIIDDETSSCNNNGLAEPGETIGMKVTLRNSGTFDSHNVTAVISTSDPDISIIDDNQVFGDIATESTARCDADFEFSISSDCKGDRDIPLAIEITSDEGTWSDLFNLHVHKNTSAYSSADNRFTLYPNPTNDIITIQLKTHGPHLIDVVSLNGQKIFIGLIEGISHQLDLSSCPKGVYFITIGSKDFVKTEKVVKL